jgi:hypothetical protein
MHHCAAYQVTKGWRPVFAFQDGPQSFDVTTQRNTRLPHCPALNTRERRPQSG